MKEKAPLRLKILFWLILGAFSTFFAEVFAGSEMFPFFNAWGLIIVFPLYMLHTVILATIVFRFGKPKFYALYMAGMLFGLYEAYMTKILWAPAWNLEAIRFGGVAVVEYAVLVLFWHAIMAFITPLFVSESLLTRSRTIANGLPQRLKSLFSGSHAFRYMAFFAVFFGIFQSINSQSYMHSIASGLSTSAVLVMLIFLWRKTSGMNYDMASLLPEKRGFAILLAGLLFMYAFFGSTMRMEALPGIQSQMTIWINYAIVIGLLYLALRKSGKEDLAGPFKSGLEFRWKRVLVLILLFTLSSAIARLFFSGISIFIILVAWALLIITGVGILVLAIRYAVSRS